MHVNTNLIETLEWSLANVLVAADFLEGRKPWKNSIINTVRKLRLVRELNRRYYIAITGTQGAGKTRLIRALYGLDTAWLSDNPGRGEKVPVFIIEKEGLEIPQGIVVKVEESGEVCENSIGPDEFRRIVTSWGDTAGNLFPILYVPKRHFDLGECGFVLLPGFEHESDQNQAWQLLMKYVLSHAVGSVIVTDQTRLAEHSQNAVMDAVMSGKAPGTKPVIAISKTEDMDQEMRDALRKRAAERFGVGDEEDGRIICTGKGEEYERAWVTKLLDALQRYVPAGIELKEARLTALDDVVDGDVDAIRGELKAALGEAHLDALLSPAEQTRDKILGAFRLARTSYRGRYEKSLRVHTSAYARKAKNHARSKYINEEEGFKNAFKNTGRWFGTTSGEREREHVKRIEECWKNPDESSGSAGVALLESDWRALGEQSGVLGVASPKANFRSQEACDAIDLLGYSELDGNSKEQRLLQSEWVAEDLRKLFGVERDEIGFKSNEKSFKPNENKELERVVKLVPALTMEYLRINQGLMLVHQDRLPSLPEAKSIGEFMTSLTGDLKETHDTTKTLLKTIGSILAVDVVIDGTVDTIPALLKVLLGGGSTGTATGGAAAASLGATLSMAAAGLIVVGVIGYKITDRVQQLDAANRGYIDVVISQYAEGHVQHCLSVYEAAMDTLEERMRDNLDRAYGLGKSLAMQDNLLRALERLDHARLSVLGDLRAKQLLA